jgi:hypothetical protein
MTHTKPVTATTDGSTDNIQSAQAKHTARSDSFYRFDSK